MSPEAAFFADLSSKKLTKARPLDCMKSPLMALRLPNFSQAVLTTFEVREDTPKSTSPEVGGLEERGSLMKGASCCQQGGLLGRLNDT